VKKFILNNLREEVVRKRIYISNAWGCSGSTGEEMFYVDERPLHHEWINCIHKI